MSGGNAFLLPDMLLVPFLGCHGCFPVTIGKVIHRTLVKPHREHDVNVLTAHIRKGTVKDILLSDTFKHPVMYGR